MGRSLTGPQNRPRVCFFPSNPSTEKRKKRREGGDGKGKEGEGKKDRLPLQQPSSPEGREGKREKT